MSIEDLKIRALAEHLEEEDLTEITKARYGDNDYEAHGGEYLVCTDTEADQLWDASLDNYIEECIEPELPEPLRSYFDTEAWKRDARMDGRGHSLSSYDGAEQEVKIDGEWIFIYRTN